MNNGEVTVSARLRLSFRSAGQARAVGEALRVDNAGGKLRQRTRGRAVELEVRATGARSLRETLEDWLRCAATAEGAAQAAARRSNARP